jgi:SAM-dependent methyltransferase
MTHSTPPEKANLAEKANLEDTLDGITNLYEENLKNHGQSSKSVGWKDEESQILRFEKLTQVIDPSRVGSGISVNDLGCGYAAMFQFLKARPALRLTRYYGYDISEKMLNAARQTVGDNQEAVFIQSSKITEEADYSFVSGTFNVKLEASDQVWADYVKEALLNLAAHSRKGLAFNLLTTYVDWKQENLYYADPFLFFDFCKRHISRYVSLLHDYPLYEWTIIVRKD